LQKSFNETIEDFLPCKLLFLNYCAQYTQLELTHKVIIDAPKVMPVVCGEGGIPDSATLCNPYNATAITVERIHQIHITDFAVIPKLPLDFSNPQYTIHIINAQIK
jgi:hypothetical protein